MSTNTLALIAVALMSAAVGAGSGLFAAFPIARRDARREQAPVTPRAIGRVVEAWPSDVTQVVPFVDVPNVPDTAETTDLKLASRPANIAWPAEQRAEQSPNRAPWINGHDIARHSSGNTRTWTATFRRYLNARSTW
jgi:hypothetical protein